MPKRVPNLMLRAVRAFEALVGLGTALLVSLVLITMLILGMVTANHGMSNGGGASRWATAGMFVVMAAEGVAVCLLSDAWDHGRHDPWRPWAPQLALRMRQMPRLLRPVAVVWWLAHFGMSLAMAVAVEAGVSVSADRYGWGVQFATFVAVGFTLAFAFNLYALLALAAAGCGERAVTAAWRWRLTLDLAVAVAAAVLARHVGPR